MMLELSKSIRWSNDHACFTTVEPLAQVLTSLSDMFFLESFPVKALAGFTYRPKALFALEKTLEAWHTSATEHADK